MLRLGVGDTCTFIFGEVSNNIGSVKSVIGSSLMVLILTFFLVIPFENVKGQVNFSINI